ncbi:MAG TPA: MFS transporter [Bellilinea sp.]|nr:MFS transporter [Bellilinea sp.]
MRRLFTLNYPSQFWLMFTGMIISTIGGSMIWPFLMVYVSNTLGAPISTVALILTVNSVMGLITAFVAGPIVDRLGRKWVMVLSLLSNGLVYLAMIFGHEFWHFAVLIGLQGASQPLYRIAADAMLADLIPMEQRADGYSLFRLGNNVGVALGPAIGGFLASASYSYAFLSAFIGMTFYGLLMAFRGHETIPTHDAPTIKERFGGYDQLLRDRQYLRMVLGYQFTRFCATVVWVMLSVYTINEFHMPESLYGFIPMTNGIMVVLFQIPVTVFTKRHDRYWMMALGATLYGVAAFSIILARGFFGFWMAMVIMTIGELILEPTSSTQIANLAPPSMRGRYMSVYGLTYNVAHGISPVVSGALSDKYGPQAMWVYAGSMGMISALIYVTSRRLADSRREGGVPIPITRMGKPSG